MTWLLLIGLPVAIYATYLVWRARVGHLIGVHLFLFEQAYDQCIHESKSKKTALRESLVVFRSCPRLNRITEAEFDMFSEIIGTVQDPKHVVKKLILGMASTKIIKTFRDPQFLEEVAVIYRPKVNSNAG